MVAIFREIKRVLRDDGVAWLIYGDCYAGGGRGGHSEEKLSKNRQPIYSTSYKGIPQGNLMFMPHRIAIALQNDGWIARNDVVWHKKNPMVESVFGCRWERKRIEKSREIMGGKQPTNLGSMSSPEMTGGVDKVEWEYEDDFELKRGSWRHTRAHEYVFQLVKKMQYYCDQEAIREFGKGEEQWAGSYDEQGSIIQGDDNRIGKSTRRYSSRGGRNPRSVISISAEQYKGSHYATFPSHLIAKLIKVSCPNKSCPVCGKAWAPVIEVSGEIIDYRPICLHKYDPIPGIVLDPFLGSGTTGLVARHLQRRWIGIDISMEYLDQQAKPRALKLTPKRALEGLPLFDHEQT